MIFFGYKGDINKAGDKVLVARGGDGGMQSNQFVGQKGDALSVTLDLKVISDIGFVGYVIYIILQGILYITAGCSV